MLCCGIEQRTSLMRNEGQNHHRKDTRMNPLRSKISRNLPTPSKLQHPARRNTFRFGLQRRSVKVHINQQPWRPDYTIEATKARDSDGSKTINVEVERFSISFSFTQSYHIFQRRRNTSNLLVFHFLITLINLGREKVLDVPHITNRIFHHNGYVGRHG